MIPLESELLLLQREPELPVGGAASLPRLKAAVTLRVMAHRASDATIPLREVLRDVLCSTVDIAVRGRRSRDASPPHSLGHVLATALLVEMRVEDASMPGGVPLFLFRCQIGIKPCVRPLYAHEMRALVCHAMRGWVYAHYAPTLRPLACLHLLVVFQA